MNVFSTQGFQINRFFFGNLLPDFGKPKAVSQNGQFFLFGKKKTLNLLVCLLTDEAMVPFKEIDLEGDFKDYLNEIRANKGDQEADYYKDFWDHKKYKYTMQINDYLDICIKFDPIISQKSKDDDPINKLKMGFGKLLQSQMETFFYIQKGTFKLSKTQSTKISENRVSGS